jgi:RHS repeat-associated protein
LSDVFTADNTTAPALIYNYDSLYRVKTAQDAVSARQGTSVRPAYQFFIGEGVRADRIDPAGGNYTVVYDIYRRPIQYYDELARETTVVYDGRGRVTSYTYPELNQQVFAYDDHNNTTSLTRIAKPGSPLTFPAITAAWNQTWNKPSSITDALGCLTTFNYYPSGAGASLMQNATRCKPDSTQANPVYAFTYNSLGQILTSTDPTSLVVSNTYDTAANGGSLLTSTLDPTSSDPSGINALTSYAYDAVGNNTSVTDPRFNVTEYQYDANRRKTVTLHHNGAITTALLAAEKTTYDLLGRDTKEEGGQTFSGTTVSTWQTLKTTSYTDTSKVLTEADGAGDTTTYGYDPMDRAILVTDPVYRRVGTVYDLAGQTLCTWRGWDTTTAPTSCSGWIPSSYNGTGKVLYASYVYSLNGKQTSITDANNNTTGMTYDGADRLVTLAFPLPTAGSLAVSTTDYEAYTYDSNDNRKSVRKRDGQVINYNFDSLNRQVTKILPGTTTADVWSTYDLAGRPLTDYFGSSTAPTTSGVAYGYDTAKRMTSETQFGRSMSYTYDNAGNRIQTSWPDSPTTNYINYDFDAMNREYQIREAGATSGAGVLAVYTYDNLSRRHTLTRGNGAITNFGYDSASRLDSLGHDVAGTAQDVTVNYSYTLAGQLQTRGSNNGLYDWLPAAASSTAYVTSGLNAYSSVGGVAYGYDLRGNMTSDGTNSYTYDVENRLLTASGPTAVSLAYDPLGRLQSTTVGATATQYLYSGTKLVAELDGLGNVLRRYVHGPGTDDPVVWYEGSTLATRNYLHADERGSVIAASDNAGSASANIYTYGSYGEPNPGWTGSRFRYTGQTAIPEAQLYYYKARVYSPKLGRFLQTDPVGSKDDLNLYTYVGNDPLDKTDASGLEGEANTCSRVGGSSCSGNYNGDGFHGKAPSNGTGAIAERRIVAQEVFIPKPVIEPLIEGTKTGVDDIVKPRNGQELLDQLRAEREGQYREFKSEIRQPESVATEAARLGQAWKAEDSFLHNLLRIVPKALEALKDIIGHGLGGQTALPAPAPPQTPQQQCHMDSCWANFDLKAIDLEYKIA